MPEDSGKKPVVDGLMRHSGDTVELLAARCKGCSHVYFPRVVTCRNPRCPGGKIEETALSRQGSLYSYTVQHYQPPALFRIDEWKPYAIGLVEMEEGIRVMGMLSGVDLSDIRIGDPYCLSSAPLYTDDEGNEVVTHVFIPTALEGRPS